MEFLLTRILQPTLSCTRSIARPLGQLQHWICVPGPGPSLGTLGTVTATLKAGSSWSRRHFSHAAWFPYSPKSLPGQGWLTAPPLSLCLMMEVWQIWPSVLRLRLTGGITLALKCSAETMKCSKPSIYNNTLDKWKCPVEAIMALHW